MPDLSIPRHSFRKPAGQSRVRMDGKDVCPGRHGPPETFQMYQDAIANWQSQHTEVQVKKVDR